jgi:hypothetical protein
VTDIFTNQIDGLGPRDGRAAWAPLKNRTGEPRHPERSAQRLRRSLKDSLSNSLPVVSHLMFAEDPRRVVLAEVRDTFARTAWTHKTHEKSCDALLATERRLKLWQIGLTATTSGSVLSVLLVDQWQLRSFRSSLPR